MSSSNTSPESEEPINVIKQLPTITEDWLMTILTNYHEGSNKDAIQLIDFKVDDNEDADTALSDIFGLNVFYRFSNEVTNRQLQLILKQLPQDPFARFFVKEAQFDLREIKFYTKVVPDMINFQKKNTETASIDLPIPKCYHPTEGFEPTGESDTILVLENLKAHDYRNASFIDGLTLQEAILALKSVAKMHAISLAMKINHGQGLNERYPFLFQTDKATDSYQMLLDRGLPQLGVFLEEKPNMASILKCILNIRPKMKTVISALLSARDPMSLLTHTDFWCNNLLFKNNDDCVILDWQMATYSHPTNDIALLIISSLPTNLRRESTNELLDHYWEAFIQHCTLLNLDIESKFAYTRTSLQEDYRKSQLLAVLLCIGSVDVALGHETTESRLLDVLEDLYEEKIFSDEFINECIKSHENH